MAEKELDELMHEIDEIRIRLGASIDELADYVKPGAVAARGAQNVRGHFVDEDGSVRLDRVVPIAFGVVALIGLGKLGRALFRD